MTYDRKPALHKINVVQIKLITNWLIGRPQNKLYMGKQLSYDGVSGRIPRGSVLGPTLFCICFSHQGEQAQLLLLKCIIATKMVEG